MTLAQLRERAAQSLARVREIQARIEGADDPSAEDRQALDAAIAESNAAFDAVAAAERNASTIADLERRAQNPGERLGGPPAPHTDPSNTRRGRHEYSLIRAIQGELNQREGRGRFDGLERETHDHLASLRGRSASGLIVPWDAPIDYRGPLPNVHRRDLSTSTGSGAVPTIVRPTMVDVLRARLVLVQVGATLITDMHQPFQLPKTTAAQSGTWVSTEGTTVAATNPTIGQVPFTWKSVEAKTKLTRQFINNASVQAESYAVDQLTKAVATTVQSGVLNGTGATGQPKGLFTYVSGDGIGTLALNANGANPTWANMLSMTGTVDTANAPDESRAWLFNPATVAYLQGAPKVTGYPTFILDGVNSNVAGYPYQSTSLLLGNISKGTGTNLSQMAFGAWSELVIALFTGLDLFIDPYSAQPHVNVTMAQDCDVNFLHLASFVTCQDVKTS